MRKFLLCLLLCVIGCSNPPVEKEDVVSPLPVMVEQTCDHCGQVMEVYSIDGSKVPSTVEWCFYDGGYCVEGWDYFVSVIRHPDDYDASKRLLDHLEVCFGCKAAVFSSSLEFEEAKRKLREEEKSNEGQSSGHRTESRTER
jgi:hypothetical protein